MYSSLPFHLRIAVSTNEIKTQQARPEQKYFNNFMKLELLKKIVTYFSYPLNYHVFLFQKSYGLA